MEPDKLDERHALRSHSDAALGNLRDFVVLVAGGINSLGDIGTGADLYKPIRLLAMRPRRFPVAAHGLQSVL
jgi:hypothetical protein